MAFCAEEAHLVVIGREGFEIVQSEPVLIVGLPCITHSGGREKNTGSRTYCFDNFPGGHPRFD
jgi:hypothetical protein